MKIASLMLSALMLSLTLDAPAQAPAPAPTEPPQFLGMVEAHNLWRRKVGAPDLVWSTEAARWAQSWAEELADNECQAKHNGDDARREAFGENIYYYWSSRPYDGYRRDPATVVKAWGDEVQYYDEASNQCTGPRGKTCRHYTQLVWSRSTAVGCARARCESAEIWVCNYSPRGNILQVRPYEPGAKTAGAAAAPADVVMPVLAAPADPPQ